MSLSNEQLLVIHGVLFQQVAGEQIKDLEIADSVRSAFEAVEAELLSNQSTACSHDLRTAGMAVAHDDLDEDHDDDLDEELDEESYRNGERILSIDRILELEGLKVFDPNLKKSVKVEFFWSNGPKGTELGADLIDSNFSNEEIVETIEHIPWITRTGRELFLGTAKARSKVFSVSKFPKSWTSLLDVRFKYRVK